MRARIGIAAAMVLVAATLVAFTSRDHGALEVHRIQAHFDSVLVELRAADVAALATDQRTRRSLLIETLVAYRHRGLFPRNYDFEQAPTPYFIDRKTGVLCAVAHLIESTGRRDIVDRVAAMNNNVWVPQLAGDTAFEGWLSAHGMTLAEAARIQVPYDFIEQPPPPPAPRNRSAVVGLGLASAATAVNLLSNRDGHGRVRSVAGLAAGVVGAGVGVAAFNAPGASRGATVTSIATGLVSAAVSARGIYRHRQMVAAAREAERAKVAVAPLLPTSTTGTGITVNVRF